MYDIEQIEPEHFFSDYLAETYHLIQPFNTMGWLAWLDADTLKLLNKYASNYYSEASMDNDIANEILDFSKLADDLACIEMGIPNSTSLFAHKDCHWIFVARLGYFVTNEILRRQGIVTIKGDGNLSSQSTEFPLTELGNAIKKNRGAS